MDKTRLKQLAAEEALSYIEKAKTIGVGSGSTVQAFIALLGNQRWQTRDIVCASEESASALRKVGIQARDLNACDEIEVYIDGCDEITPDKIMIKGGGAALTREKICAAAAKQFVCIADFSKEVSKLGQFPLPVEVIPMARSYVARELLKLGGQPRWREGVVTDNGNWILDVHHLQIDNPVALENTINQIAGVVCVGIFAKERADVVITAQADGTLRVW